MARHRRIVIVLALGMAMLVGGLALWGWLGLWAPRLVIHAPGAWVGWDISGDGRWLTTSGATRDGRQELRSWDLATGAPRREGPAPLVVMRSDAADGRSAVGVMDDPATGRRAIVRIDTATGAILARFDVGLEWPMYPHFAAGGRAVRAYLTDPQRDRVAEVLTWDLSTGTATRQPFGGPPAGEPEFRPVAATPDVRALVYLAEHGDDVLLWDGMADRPIGPLPRPAGARIARVVSPAVAADGRTLVIPLHDGRAEVWALPEGRLLRVVSVHSRGFHSMQVALTPDGRLLASGGGRSGPVRVDRRWAWLRSIAPALYRQPSVEVVVVDLADGRRLARFPDERDPLISPDGRTLVTRRERDALPDRTIPAAFPVRTIPAPPAPRPPQ